MKLTLLILLLIPLLAQEPSALAIRNVHYDTRKATVDFDVVSQSPKPVRSWLISVALGNGTSLVTPQNCQGQHCTADVDFGDVELRRLQPEVHVKAIVFEDGTAEGDLRMLQSEIDDARLRLHALEAWQKDFDKTPPDIAYTGAVMNEREIVELLAAKLTPGQRAAMLEQRTRTARELTGLFPVHDPPYAPAETVASTRPIANRTRLAIVHEEERDGKLRLVLRNDYSKEILAFAFMQHRADGTIMRSSSGHAIAPGGFEEFPYGAVPAGDSLELACVMFRDGTADGDPAVIQKIRDGSAGRRAEKARILPLVRAVANLPTPERAAAIEKLIADLKSHVQEQPDAEHSVDVVLGEQAEHKAVLRELRESSLREVLKDLQE